MNAPLTKKFKTHGLSDTQQELLMHIAYEKNVPVSAFINAHQASAREAHNKEQRLRDFYKRMEQEEGWVLPTISLDYLRQFEPEGTKRKNGVTESALHQIKPGLWLAGLYNAGVLPPRVTYQIIDGKKISIPKEGQSIEHVFATINTHDTFEDHADSTAEEMRYFFSDRLDSHYETIDYLVRSTDAITFDFKTYDKDRKIVKKSKYPNDDRQLYTDDMEKIWSAITAKAPDRLWGINDRFTKLPDLFSFSKQAAYKQETKQLFLHRQTIERMQKHYPELAPYFKVVNANMSIAYRCLSVILDHHPNNPHQAKNHDEARIEFENFLENAFIGAQYIRSDIAPLQEMLDDYKALAERMPHYKNLVDQMEHQLTPYLSRHPSPDIEIHLPHPRVQLPLALS